MQISKSLKTVIVIELIVPISLLTLGIYHGLMQTIYRSGFLHQSNFLKLDYYQGLTLHGVINAIVLTTFFAVAFGHATITYYLKKEANILWARVSMWLMIIGTCLAAWAMISGNASVLYTFYPPLKAHPLFYIGTALLIVGSWIPLFNWAWMYNQWKRYHKEEKTPLAVIATIVNFTIWFVCTLAVAYEVLVLLVPWSLGWTKTVDVTLSRTLFWFFGHALVYFWLLPAYIIYYTMLPKLAGGKLYSDVAARLTFFLFLVLSIPVGVHHQFADPGITRGVKMFQGLLTFGIAIPSFMTAFNLAASLEYAGKLKGAKGLFGWVKKLPFLDPDKYLFAYMICGLILFIFGGLTGIPNASFQLNNVIHNTAFLPGHFHMTVAGPVFLGIIGMSTFLLCQLTGKKIFWPKMNVMVPYLWMIGVFIFSTGLMWGGLIGEPRRTNLGLTYLNPSSPLYRPDWVPTTTLALAGGIIMFIAGMIYFIVFFGTIFKKRSFEPLLELPESEPLMIEKGIAFLDRFKPWLIIMGVVLVLAYFPPLYTIYKNAAPKALPYKVDSPIPDTLRIK